MYTVGYYPIMTTATPTPARQSWYAALTDRGSICAIINAVSARVSIQEKDYPKIEKAAVKIARDRVESPVQLPRLTRENVMGYVRTIADQIIATLISKYPNLEIPNRAIVQNVARPTAVQVVSMGDPRLNQQRLTLTPLNLAYQNFPSTDAPITRVSTSRDRQRELARRAVRRNPR